MWQKIRTVFQLLHALMSLILFFVSLLQGYSLNQEIPFLEVSCCKTPVWTCKSKHADTHAQYVDDRHLPSTMPPQCIVFPFQSERADSRWTSFCLPTWPGSSRSVGWALEPSHTDIVSLCVSSLSSIPKYLKRKCVWGELFLFFFYCLSYFSCPSVLGKMWKLS